jgi:hypothetical protein
MLLGKKASDPLGPPTWMVCVVTPMGDIPAGDEVELAAAEAEAVCDARDSEAEMERADEADWAAAKPMRADTMKDFANMFADERRIGGNGRRIDGLMVWYA